jgi:hypothetical protein
MGQTMQSDLRVVPQEEIDLFRELVNENRYDFCKLVYIVFPFGQKGHELEFKNPYPWQMAEWAKLSKHLSDPATRYETYRLAVSSGNGAAKTAFGAMTFFMVMYTQQVKARITANTQPQMKSVIWPEYDNWFRHARYHEHFFEKLGESIKSKNEDLANVWRLDAVTWNEASPAAFSGLHNKDKAIMVIFEEAPGIPAVVWNYASGALTDTDTIKIMLAFGNSDDPESKFEQNMMSPHWHSKRIDTRTMTHVDPKQIAVWLEECGGNEDHDEFRVRVRGLPRKAAKDSIISQEAVSTALRRADTFDIATVRNLPVILTCDPAWTGGDETTIWYRQGHYARMLEKFRLDKTKGEDHMKTYLKLCEWENTLHADAVFIDQGEGTAIKTLANNAGKNWELVAFSNSPNDTLDPKDSEYANIRAQMYYEANKWLMESAVLDAREPEWKDEIAKQLCWTKGARHKVTGKKLCEAKTDIKTRVGQSPDVADGFVLAFARKVRDRLEENDISMQSFKMTGANPYKMPEHQMSYENIIDGDYKDLYG